MTRPSSKRRMFFDPNWCMHVSAIPYEARGNKSMKRSLVTLRLLFGFNLLLAPISAASGGQLAPWTVDLAPQKRTLRIAAADDFIRLALPDGSEGRLDANSVIRIRRALTSESQRGAKTRIDWLQTMLVRESPEDVANRFQAPMPTLGKLLLPDRSPVWFNARFAEGLLPLPSDRLQNGVQSGMVLGNMIQLLANSPEQVRDEISAKGGKPLPVPAPGARNVLTLPLMVWDSDLQ